MDELQEQLIQQFVGERARYLGYLRVMCRDEDRAEELFQELSVVVVRDIAKFEASRDFGAWVRGICRVLYRKSLERAQRRARKLVTLDPELFDAVLAVYDEPEREAAERKAAWTAVLGRCVEQLTPEHRDMLSSRYERGLSSAQIGATFQRSAAAVDTMLFRLRAVLLDCVKRHAEAEA